MGRELTAKEKRVIAQSVMKQCANYDSNYKECLPEEANCYMMTIGFDDTELCRYYEKCILPIEAEVEAIFRNDLSDWKICDICGNKFKPYQNQTYCSGHCANIARKRATAKRVRKHRKNKHDM